MNTARASYRKPDVARPPDCTTERGGVPTQPPHATPRHNNSTYACPHAASGAWKAWQAQPLSLRKTRRCRLHSQRTVNTMPPCNNTSAEHSKICSNRLKSVTCRRLSSLPRHVFINSSVVGETRGCQVRLSSATTATSSKPARSASPPPRTGEHDVRKWQTSLVHDDEEEQEHRRRARLQHTRRTNR